MKPTGITWRASHGGNVFTSACGPEGQGIAHVIRHGDGWRWTLDMLPGDAEPLICSADLCASAQEAMQAVQRQVANWPVLIEGAVRR